MKKLLLPFYPILLGIIWVLTVYLANKESLPSASIMIIPMLVVTAIIAAVWFIANLIVKDWKKSALIVTVIFLLTIAHGYIREYTNIVGIKMVPIWLALMAAGIFAIVKVTRPKGRDSLTVIGNVVCVAILVVSLVSSSLIEPPYSNVVEAATISKIHNPTPDVYYIIPDCYTSNYVLSNYMDYDNSEFTNFLISKGFTVKNESFANYSHTILSVSSVMNMKYWSDEELGNYPTKVLGSALYENPVGDTFSKADYEYIQLGSWWSFTASNKAANVTYRYSTLNELGFELYRLTVWYDLFDYLFDLGGNRLLRNADLRQFRNLIDVSDMPEHTFTFCHFILPHPPFVFDANGNPASGWILPPEEWKRMYLDQLTYTNKLLENAITEILSNSEVTPIIVISADEGYSDVEWQAYLDTNHSLDNIVRDRPDLVTERQGNLFAILNPYSSDIPSSPVNIFPTIFNCLFSSNLTYLPDKYYLKSLDAYPGCFIDITEFINGRS